MNKKTVALVLAAFVGFSVAGCGSDSDDSGGGTPTCADLCARHNSECNLTDDCATQCAMADNPDCKTETDAYLVCGDGLATAAFCSDTDTTCDSQLNAMIACLTAAP
jgi:hypothetical protein